MPTLRLRGRTFAPQLKPATPAQRLRALLPAIACLVLLACTFAPVRYSSHGWTDTTIPNNSYVATTGTIDLQVTPDPACSAGWSDSTAVPFQGAPAEHAPLSGVLCVKNISDQVTPWHAFVLAETEPGDLALTTQVAVLPPGELTCPTAGVPNGPNTPPTQPGQVGWWPSVLLSDAIGTLRHLRPAALLQGANQELPPASLAEALPERHRA